MSDNAGSGDGVAQTVRVSEGSVPWGKRLKDSILGVGSGFLLVLLACGGLFWNEGRAVQTARSLTEGATAVASVPADRIDPGYDGRLVHVAGPVRTGEPLADPDFGLSVGGIVRLVRSVEMYQWEEQRRTETRRRYDGENETVTVYTYRQAWLGRRQDSSRFREAARYNNPEMRYAERDVVSRDAALGAFRPGEEVLRMIAAREELPLGIDLVTQLRSRFDGPLHVVDNRIYLGADPANPRLGDHRVSYRVARAHEMSVVGRQTGNGFAAYQTRAGDRLLMAAHGIVPADIMFSDAERRNSFLTWLLRVLGVVAMAAGFAMVLRPLAVLGERIPFLGPLLSTGVGLAAGLMTAVLASVILAAAWFYYRPLLSLGILAGGAAIAVAIRLLAARRAAAAAQPQRA